MTALTHQTISQLAAEYGFSAAYCFMPLLEDGAPKGVRTLVLLTRTYAPGGRLVDHFYPCSNKAYHQAKLLGERLTTEYSVQTWRLSNLRLKPMCRRLAAFGTGLNTLNYLPKIGSRFCMELLGLSEKIDPTPMIPYPVDQLPCARCRRCMAACPTGAITENGFIKERCIRFHMMNGKTMPEEMRSLIGTEEGTKGILGCEICQRVCPANAQKERERSDTDDFTLAELLCCDAETLAHFGELYGKNYAIRNRILAQAVLIAAHQGEQYREEMEALKDSPSPVVAEHAAWALKK